MDEIEQLQKDALTGTYTREYLLPILKKRIFNAKLRKEKFSILLVDIDHFKNINDKYGHLCGDQFLKYVTSALRSTLEDKGLIFRYGGDEFVVLFSTPDPKQAFLLAKQFNLLMGKRPFIFNARLFKMSVSCGLATYPDDARDPESLLKIADKALYFAKRYHRSATIRAIHIGLQRFKIAVLILLKVTLFVTLILFFSTFIFKPDVQKRIKSSLVDKLFSIAKPDTKIILRNGTIIKVRIVAEDRDKIVVIMPLNKKSTKMIFRKLEFNAEHTDYQTHP
jgi:diguanylate cyclase (GGDEF)-like protein